jgi:hypothetical protein
MEYQVERVIRIRLEGDDSWSHEYVISMEGVPHVLFETEAENIWNAIPIDPARIEELPPDEYYDLCTERYLGTVSMEDARRIEAKVKVFDDVP